MVITIRLTPDQKRKLQAMAEVMQRSKSGVIRWLIIEEYEKYSFNSLIPGREQLKKITKTRDQDV